MESNLPLILSSTVAGFILGKYVNVRLVAAKTTSNVIDTYVDLKWAWKDFWNIKDQDNVTPNKETHEATDVILVNNDGTKTAPSPVLFEFIKSYGEFTSGKPTLDHLKNLQHLADELAPVKKIIVNLSNYDEHIIN